MTRLLAFLLGCMVGWMLPRPKRRYDISRDYVPFDDPGVLFRNWAHTGSADLIARQRQREAGNVTMTPRPEFDREARG